MKTKLIIITAMVIACGTGGLIAWSNRPADQGEIRRQKADKIMCQNYGENWSERYIGCRKTNRVQFKTMALAYEVAIGFRRAK